MTCNDVAQMDQRKPQTDRRRTHGQTGARFTGARLGQVSMELQVHARRQRQRGSYTCTAEAWTYFLIPLSERLRVLYHGLLFVPLYAKH